MELGELIVRQDLDRNEFKYLKHFRLEVNDGGIAVINVMTDFKAIEDLLTSSGNTAEFLVTRIVLVLIANMKPTPEHNSLKIFLGCVKKGEVFAENRLEVDASELPKELAIEIDRLLNIAANNFEELDRKYYEEIMKLYGNGGNK